MVVKNPSCSMTKTNSNNCSNENHSRALFDKRMGNEFPGETLGAQYAGYVFKITGGNDKDGFTMRQGIMKNGRVRILMAKGHKCYRPRRDGQRKRKSVRGCIVGKDISVLALTIIKHGEQPIAGITDVKRPRKLGPKRASKIRRLYNLEKKDDVRKFVVRRTLKNGKQKAPKIQRLVTNDRIRRKRVIRKIKQERLEATKKAVGEYKKLITEYRKQHKRVAKPAGKVEGKPAPTSAPSTVPPKP